MSSTELSTRDRILEATWRLMAEHQGQNVRIEEIAKAAHVSRQAVYLHFGTRAELLTATTYYVDEALNWQKRVREACNAETGELSLEGWIAAWGNYIPDIYGLAKALLIAAETDTEAAVAWKARMDQLYEACQMIVQQISRDGQLAPEWTSEVAAVFFWSMLSVRNWENLTIERGWTQTQYVERMQLALRRTLLKTAID
jgi:AcrR family transcriptional regulator